MQDDPNRIRVLLGRALMRQHSRYVFEGPAKEGYPYVLEQEDFERVYSALMMGVISEKRDPALMNESGKAAALYDTESDTIRAPVGELEDEPVMLASLMHEAVHAIADAQNWRRVLWWREEAIAFVVTLGYLQTAGLNSLSWWMQYRLHRNPIYAVALKVVREYTAPGQGGTIPFDAIEEIGSVIRATPPYDTYCKDLGAAPYFHNRWKRMR